MSFLSQYPRYNQMRFLFDIKETPRYLILTNINKNHMGLHCGIKCGLYPNTLSIPSTAPAHKYCPKSITTPFYWPCRIKINNYFTKDNDLLPFSSTILKQCAALSLPVLGKSVAGNHLLSALLGFPASFWLQTSIWLQRKGIWKGLVFLAFFPSHNTWAACQC